MGAEKRYKYRQSKWNKKVKVLPKQKHYFWWFVHNCVSHPILGLVPCEKTVNFHDWTSKHLNLHKKIRNSPIPKFPSYKKWLIHNTFGHILIGVCPTKTAFKYHDKTAEEMEARPWV